MQVVSAVSSESSVSFILTLGESVVGCLLPRKDSFEFTQRLENMIGNIKNSYFMEEFEYDTEVMNITAMSSMDAIMIYCKNKKDETAIQLTMDVNLCSSLIERLKNVENSCTKINGPIVNRTGSWNFFEIRKTS